MCEQEKHGEWRIQSGVTNWQEENAPMGETWRLRNVAARDVSNFLGERWRGLALAKEKRVAIAENDEDDVLDAERALLAGAKQGQTTVGDDKKTTCLRFGVVLECIASCSHR